MNGLMLRLMLIASLFLGGCSMESAINAFSSAEDRQLAQDMVRHLRSGNEDWLRERFDPAVWEESRSQIAAAPRHFPSGEGETRLIGFQTSSLVSSDRGSEARKQFTLVTEGEGRWTITSFETHSTGGPFRVIAWRVVPHSERPPELALFEASERMVPWLWALGVGFLLVLVGILVAFIRYRRRKRAQLMR